MSEIGIQAKNYYFKNLSNKELIDALDRRVKKAIEAYAEIDLIRTELDKREKDISEEK